jgi:sarcosine oxidase subunit alpha
MFRRLPEAGTPDVTVFVDGRVVRTHARDSVAAALLAAGYEHFRTTAVSGAERGPWCLMGACFDCLVTIDGVGNRQACMVRVREGMRIELQRGKRELTT